MRLNKILIITSLVGLIMFQIGCQSNNESSNLENEINESVDTNALAAKEKAQKVFYSLPSPIETALLLKRAGAKFNDEYLNPVDNITKYTSTKKMALNLGVYSADLSFVSMFDQSQYSVKYLSAVKKMADELGVLNAVDQSIFDRMDKNMDNPDSLMEIISETFMNSDAFLKENDRMETAAIVLVGGWIEGLYIATEIAKSTENNKEIVQRIIDQRNSLNTLLNLLNEYKDNPDVKDVIADLKEIDVLFNKIKVTNSDVKVVQEDGKSVIKSDTKTEYNPEDINALFDKVIEIRTKIVS
jgi:hypothetical protein